MPSPVIEILPGQALLNCFIKPSIGLLIELGVELLLLWVLQSMILYPFIPVPLSLDRWYYSVLGLPPNIRSSTRLAVEKQHSTHPVEEVPSITTINERSSQSDDLSWDEVLGQLNGTDWEPQDFSGFDEMYRSRIQSGFALEHVPHTKFIWHNGTDTIAALCASGVYGFGVEFEYGYLISETNKDALTFMINPGSRPRGPTRRGWGTYDVTAEDVFGDKFGDETDGEDEYSSDADDSGIEDCYDSDTDGGYR